MTTRKYLTLTPRDPVIARDGRPFGAGQGQRMRAADWIYPTVAAGSLRTLIGKMHGGGFAPPIPEALKTIGVRGPFPAVAGELYLPAPGDIAIREEDGEREWFASRPVDLSKALPGGGCDLPDDHLQPAMLPESVGENFKAAAVLEWWSRTKITKWLVDPRGDGRDFCLCENARQPWGYGFFAAPRKDLRWHVSINHKLGAAAEGLLFATVGLDLTALPPGIKDSVPNQQWGKTHLSLRVEVDSTQDILRSLDPVLTKLNRGPLDEWHPLGGERRLVRWQHAGTSYDKLWSCPVEVIDALNKANRVRMVLASPAVFAPGWMPDWLKPTTNGWVGSPPRCTVQLKLIGACVDRWRPISGWNLDKSIGQPGPKPVRRMVPPGSVYFFEVCVGQAADLAKLWLESVCEDKQDHRDGFGLALWGVWEPHPEIHFQV